jgi:hypothetical protein
VNHVTAITLARLDFDEASMIVCVEGIWQLTCVKVIKGLRGSGLNGLCRARNDRLILSGLCMQPNVPKPRIEGMVRLSRQGSTTVFEGDAGR